MRLDIVREVKDMKRSKAVVVQQYREMCQKPAKDETDVGNTIRTIADNDEGFENLVFELGLRVLRKELMKQDANK